MNYKKLIEGYKVDMLDALRRFVQIPSVYNKSTSTKTMPFGKDVDDALVYVARLGEKFGFDVDRCDGYCTELTIGEGDRLISIFAHADVVPATGKWTKGPFEPYIEDGKLIGRGSSDDKGPMIAAFYAAKALKDAGLIRNYRVRIVVGGDEERGSSCLIHYFDSLKKESPTYGFTPDSSFPLIYGEKAITGFEPVLDVDIPDVISIKGGLVSNAVCDLVKVTMKKHGEFAKYLRDNKVNFEENEDGVTFFGKSCHGSMPQFGINAALIAVKSLGDFYKIEKLSKLGEGLQDTSGKAFGCYKHSKLLDDTTYCVGIISYENKKLKLVVNFRYGEEVNKVEMIKLFDKYFGTKSEYDDEESHYLLYEPDCFLVKTLLEAYQKETGDYKKHSMITGGGTYAKHAKNTIAFGAEFPGIDTKMHEPDEFIRLEDFYQAAVIYARAIHMLGTKNED